jgi:hypothetical protein
MVKNRGSSCLRTRCARVVAAAVLGALSAGIPRAARAQAFDNYQPAASFSLPGSGGPMGVTNDGRILTVVGTSAYLETAAGSRTFAALGVLSGADFPSFGAAFVRVSPDGTKFAVGNNGGASFSSYKVGVFTLNTLSGAWFNAAHSDAAWVNNRYLAVSAGTFGSPSAVSALDTTSNPAAPSSIPLVSAIGGASAGVVFDAAGNLFTGNGFRYDGPSVAGSVRGVTAPRVQTSLSGGSATNFETQAEPIITLLSASPLQFDAEGNLFIAGGDSVGGAGAGFAGIVRASAVTSALGAGGPINPNDTTAVRKFDPDTSSASNFYSVTTNKTRTEFYLQDAGNAASVYLYAAPPACSFAKPTLGSGAPTGALLVLAGFVLALRRHRSR